VPRHALYNYLLPTPIPVLCFARRGPSDCAISRDRNPCMRTLRDNPRTARRPADAESSAAISCNTKISSAAPHRIVNKAKRRPPGIMLSLRVSRPQHGHSFTHCGFDRICATRAPCPKAYLIRSSPACHRPSPGLSHPSPLLPWSLGYYAAVVSGFPLRHGGK